MNSYISRKTGLMLLNPITKGLLTIFFILIFSLGCNTFYLAFGLNLFIAFFVLFLRENLLELIISLKKILLLLVIVGIFQGFVGDKFDYLASLTSVFKIIGVFFIANLYTKTSTQNELLYFWELCFKPIKLFGLSSNELALTMVIAIRFLPVFIDEIERIRIAQIARGAKIRQNAIARVINLMPLIIPILTQAIRRSEELADAMEVRGYVPDKPRGHYIEYKFSKYDFIAYIILTFVLVLVAFYHYSH